MKLDAARFAIAAANVWAGAALICGLFYKASPNAYEKAANLLLHTNMFTSTRPFGWGELIGATIAWWVIAAALVGVSAAIYNRSVRV